jgi:hypothetical protein
MSPQVPAWLNHGREPWNNGVPASFTKPGNNLSTRRKTLPAQASRTGGGLEWFGPAARNVRLEQIASTRGTMPAIHINERRQTWLGAAGSWAHEMTGNFVVSDNVRKRVRNSMDVIGKVATFIVAEYPCGDASTSSQVQKGENLDHGASEVIWPSAVERTRAAIPLSSDCRRRTQFSGSTTAVSPALLLHSPGSPSCVSKDTVGKMGTPRGMSVFKVSGRPRDTVIAHTHISDLTSLR